MTVKEYEEYKRTLKDCLYSVVANFDPSGVGLIARALVELENHRECFGLTDK